MALTKRLILEMAMGTVRNTTDLFLHTDFTITENETAVIRWDYGDPELGSCKETIQGGNHFRYWVQNGPNGNRCSPTAFENLLVMAEYAHPSNSGSIFMAASYELPIARTFPVIRLVFSFTDGNIQNNIVLSHLAITSDGNLRSRPLCLNLN